MSEEPMSAERRRPGEGPVTAVGGLGALLAAAGDRTDQPLGAHRPLPLESEEEAWVVTAGHVELFALTGDGARHHLATVEAGGLLLGSAVFGEEGPDRQLEDEELDGVSRALSVTGLLAVGHPATRVLGTSREELRALARQGSQGAAAVARALDGWLMDLGSRVPSAMPPKADQELAPGEETRLAPEAVARPSGRITWVRPVAGDSWLLGDPRQVVTPADGLLPVGPTHWLVAPPAPPEPIVSRDGAPGEAPVDSRSGEDQGGDEALDATAHPAAGGPSGEEDAAGVRLSSVATPILVQSGAVWGGLERFHGRFRVLLEGELRRRAQGMSQRLAERRARDRSAVEAAHLELASILGRADPLPGSGSGIRASGIRGLGGGSGAQASVEALQTALAWVAEAQGLEILPPASVDEASGGTGTGTGRQGGLERILATSRVRYRRVLLRDDWWRRDNGPLLAYRSPEVEGGPRRPVALVPTSPRSYELLDPAEAPGQRARPVPVDEALAETLEGGAVMLYPALPERPVGLVDLLRLGLRGRGRDILTVLLMGLGAGLLALLVPLFTGYVFGTVVPEADRSQLWQMTAALLVSALAAAAFQVTRAFAVLRIGGKIDGVLQGAVWDRLLELPVDFFRRYTVGDLANRAAGIEVVRNILTGEVATSLLATVFSSLSFALLFYYSPTLALVASALVGALLAVSAGLSYLQLRRQRELREIQGKIESLLFGLLGGISKLRVAGAEGRAYALWGQRFADQRRATFAVQKLANIQGVINAVYAVLAGLALFAVMGLSAELDLSVSEFLAFNAAFAQFQAAALSALGVLTALLGAIPSYERLQPLLRETPEVDELKTPAGELAGDVEMSSVTFRYTEDGPRILDDVSIRARPGEMIALVGPSGSGKSTCLRLLLGFETPDAGSIYYDAQDLPSLDIHSVRRQIGVVLQNGQPMAGDIYSNIIGNADLTLDDAWRAARMAGLDEDIKAMPMGMHTVISEQAGTFSGGQRQRLLIARAVARRPRILYFDEATSALDNRTQEIVSRSLEDLQATRVIIAHRLSTILKADRIYVLEKARVVEQGTYEELLEAGGLFSELARRQMA